MAVRAPVWRLCDHVHSQLPFGGFETFCVGRCNYALGFRHCFLQSPDGLTFERLVLGTNPFSVFVARTGFAKQAEMAFGRTLEKGFKERGSDFHSWSILPDLSSHRLHPDSRTRLSALLSLRGYSPQFVRDGKASGWLIVATWESPMARSIPVPHFDVSFNGGLLVGGGFLEV
jgi:hypothetical protein